MEPFAAGITGMARGHERQHRLAQLPVGHDLFHGAAGAVAAHRQRHQPHPFAPGAGLPQQAEALAFLTTFSVVSQQTQHRVGQFEGAAVGALDAATLRLDLCQKTGNAAGGGGNGAGARHVKAGVVIGAGRISDMPRMRRLKVVAVGQFREFLRRTLLGKPL